MRKWKVMYISDIFNDISLFHDHETSKKNHEACLTFIVYKLCLPQWSEGWSKKISYASFCRTDSSLFGYKVQ